MLKLWRCSSHDVRREIDMKRSGSIRNQWRVAPKCSMDKDVSRLLEPGVAICRLDHMCRAIDALYRTVKEIGSISWICREKTKKRAMADIMAAIV